jgi:hypothetical protein
MKTIGMIGTQLIHTYVYAMHLNKADIEFAKKAPTVPKWQLDIMMKNQDIPTINDVKLTHVFGGLEGVPEDMAGTFGLTVAKSPEELFDACDLVMVMDEQIPSRTKLVEKALKADRHVFVDKMISDNFDETKRLLEMAEEKELMLCAWSQVGFFPEYEQLNALPSGGTALVSFAMAPEIFKKYCIHPICAALGAFPGRIKKSELIQSSDNAKHLMLEQENGTSIIVGLGLHFPQSARIDYCVDGKAMVIETNDKVNAVRRSAENIVSAFNGGTPKFEKEDLIEASRLAQIICQ